MPFTERHSSSRKKWQKSHHSAAASVRRLVPAGARGFTGAKSTAWEATGEQVFALSLVQIHNKTDATCDPWPERGRLGKSAGWLWDGVTELIASPRCDGGPRLSWRPPLVFHSEVFMGKCHLLSPYGGRIHLPKMLLWNKTTLQKTEDNRWSSERKIGRADTLTVGPGEESYSASNSSVWTFSK